MNEDEDFPPARSPGPADRPWRLLVLDRSESGDPRWMLVTVAQPADVRSAELDEIGRYTDWPQVTQWVREALGRSEVGLVPVPRPLVWRIEEQNGGEASRRTPAAGLARVKAEFPAWRITATDTGFVAVRGGERIEAESVTELEQLLWDAGHTG